MCLKSFARRQLRVSHASDRSMTRPRVNKTKLFAVLDPLTRVVAARPARFCGVQTLGVDDAGTGRSLASFSHADLHGQIMVDGLAQTIVPPLVEIALHRLRWRETRRQHPPRQPVTQKIRHRVHNLPTWPFTRVRGSRTANGFVLLPRCWVMERSLAWLTRN